jgi:predicted lipid carrier protein YhbT
MSPGSEIPLFPRLAAQLIAPLPVFPVRLGAQRVVDSVAKRQPSLFERLGAQADKVFLIDPTDLPFVFRLTPRRESPRIDVHRRTENKVFDVRIAGPLAALIGMLHGAFDGDALFFSRDIAIEGDTEAALALRNALDDAMIDVAAELTASLGPFGVMVDRPVRVLLTLTEWLTGVPLMRTETGREHA